MWGPVSPASLKKTWRKNVKMRYKRRIAGSCSGRGQAAAYIGRRALPDVIVPGVGEEICRRSYAK
jgi:hypothetical protein